MNLNDAFLQVTTETEEQAKTALSSPSVGLLWLDAGFFAPERWQFFCEKAHEGGKLCGLRLPQIWRREAQRFFEAEETRLQAAGFDALLLGSLEALGFLEQAGLHLPLMLDASVYEFNGLAVEAVEQLCAFALGEAAGTQAFFEPTGDGQHGHETDTAKTSPRQNLPDVRPVFAQTLPLELSARELAPLCKRIEAEGTGAALVVYGRTRMMTSSQCVRRTILGCDKRPVTMELGDRTGARLPVKNCCCFCENRIYNAVPTLLCDQAEALARLPHRFERCEFTVETAEETEAVLRFYDAPALAKRPAQFTRAYFKRGVL